ncbi:hypothetical protein ACLKA7_004869 [Drosophila subpalustris]
MEEEEVIVISDEEMAEPPPEAYVEDCGRPSSARSRAASTRTGILAGGDPTTASANERSHHGSTGTPCTESRTLYIEAPQARNHPSYGEEPVSPPPFPALPDAGAPSEPEASREEHAVPLPEEAWRGEQMVPSPAERAEVAEPASEGEEMPGGQHSPTSEAKAREHDGGRRTVALDRGSPVFQGAHPTHPETPSGSPGTLGSLQENCGRRAVFGEQRRDPTSLAVVESRQAGSLPDEHLSARQHPLQVRGGHQPPLAGAEDAVPGEPSSLPRKRHGSRGRAQRSRSRRKRARGTPTENAIPTASAGRIAADEADQPATKPGPVREAKATKEEPPGTSLPSEPTEPREAATVSPTESELLREMEDLLDGWEPELDELLGEVGATLEPLIPRGWRVFPRGTILTAPTIQLLQGEVSRLGGEYRRSRFRVVDGEALYTVTINAAGTVTITLDATAPPILLKLSLRSACLSSLITVAAKLDTAFHFRGASNIPGTRFAMVMGVPMIFSSSCLWVANRLHSKQYVASSKSS